MENITWRGCKFDRMSKFGQTYIYRDSIVTSSGSGWKATLRSGHGSFSFEAESPEAALDGAFNIGRNSAVKLVQEFESKFNKNP